MRIDAGTARIDAHFALSSPPFPDREGGPGGLGHLGQYQAGKIWLTLAPISTRERCEPSWSMADNDKKDGGFSTSIGTLRLVELELNTISWPSGDHDGMRSSASSRVI